MDGTLLMQSWSMRFLRKGGARLIPSFLYKEKELSLPLCPVLYLQPCKVPFMVPESLRLPRRETLQTSTALVS